MDATETKIAKALAEQCKECETGIIAIRADGRAGFALLAPNHVLQRFVLVPDLFIADCYLN